MTRGRKNTPETIVKMRAAQKLRFNGRGINEITRAKLSASKMGHVASDITRAKMRASQIGHPVSVEARMKIGIAHRGPRSPLWRGGCNKIYPIEFNNILRKTIRKRDDYLCQNPRCYRFENGHHHDIHHIDYRKNDNINSNLILLCASCHAKTTTGDRDLWTKYYQAVQEMRGLA